LTLSQLQTKYLDVYLIHWPVPFKPGKDLQPVADGKKVIDTEAPGIVATWKELIRISKETDKVRAIGVSNFSKSALEKIIDATGVVPAMNQIECHPSLIQPELFEFCECSYRATKQACDAGVLVATRKRHEILILMLMTSPGKEKGIKITAYSPLGNNITGKPRIIDSPEVKEIAKRLGKEPAQVLIAWGAKQGFFVIPKSVTESRIKVSRRD
jgi:L-glyceraldehyde reductase